MSSNPSIITIGNNTWDFSKTRFDPLEKDVKELKTRYEELVKAHNELRIEMEAVRHYFANDWKKHRKNRLSM